MFDILLCTCVFRYYLFPSWTIHFTPVKVQWQHKSNYATIQHNRVRIHITWWHTASICWDSSLSVARKLTTSTLACLERASASNNHNSTLHSQDCKVFDIFLLANVDVSITLVLLTKLSDWIFKFVQKMSSKQKFTMFTCFFQQLNLHRWNHQK